MGADVGDDGGWRGRAQIVDLCGGDMDAAMLPEALLQPCSDLMDEIMEQQQQRLRRRGGGGGGGGGGYGGPEVARHVFCVTVIGREASGDTVAVRVLGFKPSFYVGLKGRRTLADVPFLAGAFLAEVRDRLPVFMRGEVMAARVCSRTPLYGYCGDQVFDVLRVEFDSVRAMRVAARRLGDRPQFRTGGREFEAVRYESRLDPMLRLFHTLDLQTCGWFELRPGCRRHAEGFATCTRCLTVDYRDLVPVESYSLAPLRLMAWDIECSSVSGMFPTPVKDYSQIASSLIALCGEARALGLSMPELAAFVVLTVMRCLRLEAGGAAAELGGRCPAALRFKVPHADPKERTDPAAVQRAVAAVAEDVRNLALGSVVVGKRRRAGGVGSGFEKEAPPDASSGDAHGAIVGILNATLPALEGDPVIQIGATINFLGQAECHSRWICTLGSCDDVEGAVVVRCETERELLLAFLAYLRVADPDLLLGYNTFGFDWTYVCGRLRELGVLGEFLRGLGRLSGVLAAETEIRASSSAMGDNILRYVSIPGVVNVDLMRVIMRSHQLSSYSLNAVSEHFINDRKDDLSPAEINSRQLGGPADRAVIARYCLKDCELVNRLAEDLRVVVNGMGLANMTFVPLPFIYIRGQGIKIYSRVARECQARRNVIVDHDDADEDADAAEEDSYEGATVQPPVAGMHENVMCVDFASLYPSLMIALALCMSTLHDPEMLPWVPDADWAPLTDPDNEVNTVQFDVIQGRGAKRRRLREERCDFVVRKPREGDPSPWRGMLPEFLKTMLEERAKTRAKAKHRRALLRDGREVVGVSRKGGAFETLDGEAVAAEEVVSASDVYDVFQKSVLEGQQLALKVIANSTYGLLGASTSQVRCKRVAACVTAAGRQVIGRARAFFEREGWSVVYGDTDSLFVSRPAVRPETGEVLHGAEALRLAIDWVKRTAADFNATLPPPLNLEYEKGYKEFIVVMKKMYAGTLVVDADDEPKLSYKGLQVTRRDSTPFVQGVQRGVLDSLLKRKDVAEAVRGVRDAVVELAEGRVPMQQLITSRRLGDREGYKVPENIPALMLAERMRAREPGSEPRPGDRVPFVFVRTDDPAAKVGQRIEHPDYVEPLNLKLDYTYYIERQLMNPVLLLLGAVVERVPGYALAPDHMASLAARVRKALEPNGYPADLLDGLVLDKVNAERHKVAKRLVFDPLLARARNHRDKQRDMLSYFSFS
jgi:DNA polymerase elongation subunit (family B)